MIEVKVVFLSTLVDITGKTEILISVNEYYNIKQLIEILVSKFGTNFKQVMFNPNGNLNRYLIISVNGKDIRFIDNSSTIIHQGDEISFLPAIAGG